METEENKKVKELVNKLYDLSYKFGNAEDRRQIASYCLASLCPMTHTNAEEIVDSVVTLKNSGHTPFIISKELFDYSVRQAQVEK